MRTKKANFNISGNFSCIVGYSRLRILGKEILGFRFSQEEKNY